MYWLFTWSMYISPKTYRIKEVFHPNLPFGVAYTAHPFLCPFFSLCFVFFLNDYHMVKEEKWNICDLKNIIYNKVNDLFFLSVSKVCGSLICLGCICLGGICPGGICPGGKCPGGYMSRGKCPVGTCPGGGGLCPRTAEMISYAPTGPEPRLISHSMLMLVISSQSVSYVFSPADIVSIFLLWFGFAFSL